MEDVNKERQTIPSEKKNLSRCPFYKSCRVKVILNLKDTLVTRTWDGEEKEIGFANIWIHDSPTTLLWRFCERTQLVKKTIK